MRSERYILVTSLAGGDPHITAGLSLWTMKRRGKDDRLTPCALNADIRIKPNQQMTEERQILCSRCLELAPESFVHVIPFFNDSAGGYVTTYHCERCWEASLEETRARLAETNDTAEITSAADFFKRHHAKARGDGQQGRLIVGQF